MCTSTTWGLSAPFIAIAMGIAGIIVSAYMYSQVDFTYLLTTNVQYGMVVLLTVFSFIALIAGIIGICAVFQFRKSMLTGFWVMMIVCMVGFSATAGVALAYPISFINSGCLSTSYAGNGYINNQTILAATRLCKQLPINCTCYLNPNSSFYNTFTTNSMSNITTNYTFPISVLNCPNWISGYYDNEISAYETTLNCAGWCSKNPYYLFSDVNRGIPERSCFDALSWWFKDYAQSAYITSFIFAGICLVLAVWMCIYQNSCIQDDLQYFTAISATMIV